MGFICGIYMVSDVSFSDRNMHGIYIVSDVSVKDCRLCEVYVVSYVSFFNFLQASMDNLHNR